MTEPTDTQRTPTPAYARAAEDAAQRGLDIAFVEHDPAGCPEPIAGVEPVKSIVVQRKDAFVMVLAPLAEQFSWPKLRALLGANKLALPTPDGAFDATGYRRGTISPLGARGGWPVILDARLAGARIGIGSGARGAIAVVEADALAAAYDATIADLVAES